MRAVVLLITFTQLVFSAPRITRAGNAASMAPFGTPGFGVAPNSQLTLEGAELGPSEPVSSAEPQATLGGVSVQVTAANGNFEAPVIYASASRVTVLIPPSVSTGEAFARITYDGQTSFPRRLLIAGRNFGVFTMNRTGTGAAEAYVVTDTLRPITLLEPAAPGNTVLLRGTGIGADLDATLEIFLGSIAARVRSLHRDAAGVDEVTFEVPSGIEACYVPVIAVIRGVLDTRIFGQSMAVSNTPTIAISAGGKTCSDPIGLTADDLTKLSQQDQIRTAGIVLGHNYADVDLADNPVGADKGIARFGSTAAIQFLRSAGIHGLPAPGACILTPYGNDADAIGVTSTGTTIDAGANLRITGSRAVATLEKIEDGSYRGSLPKGFISEGAYTIDNGDGGIDFPSFQVTATVPAPVTWTNKNKSYPISRFAPVTIEWSGGRPGAFVSTFSFSRNNEAAVYAVCTERAEAGKFTDPFYLTSSLPIDNREFGGLPALIGFGSVYSTPFQAPSIDLGLITFISLDAIYSP